MSEVSPGMLRAWTEYEPPESAGILAYRAITLQRHAFYAGFAAAISSVRREAIEEAAAWRECALYDATMEGPAFKGWDRSALDRCRRRFIESPKAIRNLLQEDDNGK